MLRTAMRLPAKIEPNEPDSGGKPPLNRKPTGGGDNDEGWGRGDHAPGALLRQSRMALGVGLGSDLMFFVAVPILLFGHAFRADLNGIDAEVKRQLISSTWQPSALHSVLLPPIVYLGTGAFLLSCISMEMARRRIFREVDVMDEWLGLGKPALRSALPWLGATLGLGTLFLIGQWMACQQMLAQGFALGGSSWSANVFYLIAALHGVHVAGGVLALTLCVTALWLLRRFELRQIAIDLTAWYWQVMGATWLLLFAAFSLVH